MQTESAWMQEELSKYQTAQACETCGGKRLNEKALSVKVPSINGPTDIATPVQMSVADAKAWFLGLDAQLSPQQSQIAKAILKEINERLGFLDNVGLDYLNLDRTSGTLSGGESQRIRLASQIGSGLSGVLYVLDEPSIGLHQRDNDRLLETLKRLRDLGNTVIVVEHDEDAIRAADHIVDLGPGAGVHGGEVVAQGKLKDILKAKGSLTADYLTGRRKIEVPAKRRTSPSRTRAPTTSRA
jgi:excinuclease ABC subunit A